MPKMRFYAQLMSETNDPEIKMMIDYHIYSTGRIVSLTTGQDLKQNVNPEGYKFVFVTVNKVRRLALVHRLVAEAFIPRPSEEHVYVRHINSDRGNNNVSNLKWLTISEWQDRTYWNDKVRNKSNYRKIGCWIGNQHFPSLTAAVDHLGKRNNSHQRKKLIESGIIILDKEKETD